MSQAFQTKRTLTVKLDLPYIATASDGTKGYWCVIFRDTEPPNSCTACPEFGFARRESWGSSLPHLHRDRLDPPCRICTETRLAPATSAPGLGSPRPHLRRDWAHPAHIRTGTQVPHVPRAPAWLGHARRFPRRRVKDDDQPTLRGERSPGADVGGVSPVPVQMWAG